MGGQRTQNGDGGGSSPSRLSRLEFRSTRAAHPPLNAHSQLRELAAKNAGRNGSAHKHCTQNCTHPATATSRTERQESGNRRATRRRASRPVLLGATQKMREGGEGHIGRREAGHQHQIRAARGLLLGHAPSQYVRCSLRAVSIYAGKTFVPTASRSAGVKRPSFARQSEQRVDVWRETE